MPREARSTGEFDVWAAYLLFVIVATVVIALLLDEALEDYGDDARPLRRAAMPPFARKPAVRSTSGVTSSRP